MNKITWKRVDDLMEQRKPLIDQRNQRLEKMFFLFRPSLRREVAEIDKQLDKIDLEIYRYRAVLIRKKIGT